jgi:CubicO group peptidase (beta-lactamase class C family)
MRYTSIPVLICILFTTCSQNPTHKNETSERVDVYLQELVERMNIPGLTVAVTRNDSVIYTGSFGVRNVDTQEQMKPQYIFHWASVSKTLVATAIMQLTERGKISLDKKLTEYLPYFSQKESFYKEITIRQVLNHTSGIDDVQDYEWDKPQYDTEAPERYVRSLSNDNRNTF